MAVDAVATACLVGAAIFWKSSFLNGVLARVTVLQRLLSVSQRGWLGGGCSADTVGPGYRPVAQHLTPFRSDLVDKGGQKVQGVRRRVVFQTCPS